MDCRAKANPACEVTAANTTADAIGFLDASLAETENLLDTQDLSAYQHPLDQMTSPGGQNPTIDDQHYADPDTHLRAELDVPPARRQHPRPRSALQVRKPDIDNSSPRP